MNAVGETVPGFDFTTWFSTFVPAGTLRRIAAAQRQKILMHQIFLWVDMRLPRYLSKHSIDAQSFPLSRE